MLILSRKKNQGLLIDGHIHVTILECDSGGVRLAIDAPKHISILREELAEAEQVNRDALAPNPVALSPLREFLLSKEPSAEDCPPEEDEGSESPGR